MNTDIFSRAPVVLVDIANVKIPADRQRKKAEADEALINSIQTNGLINPIVIHDDYTLVAGERRMDAFRKLGRETIPARIFESLPPLAAFLVELQENRARKNLSWQEDTEAVARYHQLRLDAFPGWTTTGTATDLGESQPGISRILAVAKYLDDEEVRGAATFTGAFNLIEGRANRALAAAQARGLIVADAMSTVTIPADATREEKTALLLSSLNDSITDAVTETSDVLDKFAAGELAAEALRAAAVIERSASDDDRVLHGSFLEWAPNYSGPRFDVLHCDFPYGKGYKGSNTRRTGKATTVPTYGDSSDIYFTLVDSLLEHQERLVLDQAHCIFWFDMMHYCWTVEQFLAAGWKLVQPHPLIWTKSYQGVAADTQRRPRHCYETALMFSRGDRKIRKLDKDHFEEQVDEKLHMSQKPVAMLRHFLQLVVDEHSAVLDPTCGSGTALAAAGLLGANRLLGVELEESNCDIARFILERELKK